MFPTGCRFSGHSAPLLCPSPSYPCPLGKVPILLSANLTSSRHEGSAFWPPRRGPGCSPAWRADLPLTALLLFGASAWLPPPPGAHLDCLTLLGIPLSSGLLSSAIRCPRTKTTSQKAGCQTWNTSNRSPDTLTVSLSFLFRKAATIFPKLGRVHRRMRCAEGWKS